MVENRSVIRNRKQYNNKQRPAAARSGQSSSVPATATAAAIAAARSGQSSSVPANSYTCGLSHTTEVTTQCSSDQHAAAAAVPVKSIKSKKHSKSKNNNTSNGDNVNNNNDDGDVVGFDNNSSSNSDQNNNGTTSAISSSSTVNNIHQELFRRYPIYILWQAALLSEARGEQDNQQQQQQQQRQQQSLLTTTSHPHLQLHNDATPTTVDLDTKTTTKTTTNTTHWSDRDVQSFIHRIYNGETLLHCSLLMNNWQNQDQQQQQQHEEDDDKSDTNKNNHDTTTTTNMFLFRRRKQHKKGLPNTINNTNNDNNNNDNNNFLTCVYNYLASKEFLALKSSLQRSFTTTQSADGTITNKKYNTTYTTTFESKKEELEASTQIEIDKITSSYYNYFTTKTTTTTTTNNQEEEQQAAKSLLLIDMAVFTTVLREATTTRIVEKQKRLKRTCTILKILFVTCIIPCIMRHVIKSWYDHITIFNDVLHSCESTMFEYNSNANTKPPSSSSQQLLKSTSTTTVTSNTQSQQQQQQQSIGGTTTTTTTTTTKRSNFYQWLVQIFEQPDSSTGSATDVTDQQQQTNVASMFTTATTNSSSSSNNYNTDGGKIAGFEGYQRVCSIADANLWETLMAFAKWEGNCDNDDPRPNNNNYNTMLHSPLSMHTIAITNENSHLTILQPRSASYKRYYKSACKLKTLSRRRKNQVSKSGDNDNKEYAAASSTRIQSLQKFGASTINSMVLDTILHHATTTTTSIDTTNKNNIRSTYNTNPYSILDAGCGVGGTMYAFLERMGLHKEQRTNSSSYYYEENNNNNNILPTFFYHGISLNGAEIRYSKQEAIRHDILHQAKFDQLSFDDSSLGEEKKYSAIVAIESLTFSRNLTATLANLYKALTPGGILVIVDDFSTSHTQMLAAALHKKKNNNNNNNRQRRPLLTLLEQLTSKSIVWSEENNWAHLLQTAGFHIQNISDLDLFFDLPQIRQFLLEPSAAAKRSRHPKRIVTATTTTTTNQKDHDNIRYYLQIVDYVASAANHFLEQFEKRKSWWPYKGGRMSLIAIFRRVYILWLESVYAKTSRIVRRKAYEDGDLNYLMMVCQKPLL